MVLTAGSRVEEARRLDAAVQKDRRTKKGEGRHRAKASSGS